MITGAARGIGRATLEVFLAEGARVVATDLDATTLAEVAGDSDQVVTVVGDVSVEDDARAMIEAAISAYGRIDVLVANAGVIPLSTIDQTSAADWDHVMAVDGRGMFLTCKFAIEHMARQGSGSIVLLSSISGQRGQVGQAAYGPAKPPSRGPGSVEGARCSRGGTAGQRPPRRPARARRDRERVPVAEVPGQAQLDQLGQQHRAARPGRPPGQLPAAETQQRAVRREEHRRRHSHGDPSRGHAEQLQQPVDADDQALDRRQRGGHDQRARGRRTGSQRARGPA